MSLFGALMGDFDDDLGLMNNHMNHTMNAMNMQMRSMNRLMNTFMPDPFMQVSPFDPGFQQGALMERPQMPAMPAMGLFGMPMMPNFNRLLNADIGANPGASFCQSTVMTMSSGPDGRPQIYQASTSTKTGPGGVRETRKTVQDSRTGLKKMAIGHHIGERAHIIEKEQDMRSGQLEERQEFINLEEEEAEQFDREFTSRASRGGVQSGHRGGAGMQAIMPARPAGHTSTLTIEPVEDDDEDDDDCVIQEQPPVRSAAGRHYSSAPTGPQNSGSVATTAAAATSSPAIYDLSSGNNNNYVSSRRSYLRNGHGLATPRRPLRTPPSSPLATVSTSPSIHPHPYAAHPRRQQRVLKHQHTEDEAANPSKAGKRGKKQ
ncbi:myeloid leukemia factor isoform X2 [Drosophila takahashii]|uniref:myeloid leukemia factor isoform X2 n=1 Tax=Drosophila takahashii TaxID=29030 RepID=UPI001CF81F21|nr:myeloid leukemia factor isoform X3 [Drosophila takahashii]